MATQTYNGGKTAVVKVADTVKSGDLVRFGDQTGVAETDAAVPVGSLNTDTYATVRLEGIWAPTSVSGAVTQGTRVWTATTSGANGVGATATLKTDAPADGDLLVGTVVVGKAAGSTPLQIRLEAAPVFHVVVPTGG